MARLQRKPYRFVGLTIVLLLGGFFCVRYALDSAPLTASIPAPPPMPHPNALDYYLKAHEQLIATAVPVSIPGMGLDVPWNSASPEKFTLEQKAKELAETRSVLDTLRQGFAYAYLAPPCRSFNHLLPELAKERELGRYLRFAAETKAAQGGWSAGSAPSMRKPGIKSS